MEIGFSLGWQGILDDEFTHRCLIGSFIKLILVTAIVSGGTVNTWLVCSLLNREVQGRALARDIVLCSWTRH